MAVGAMTGGGILTVLGLVIEPAGHLAPLAFVIFGTLTILTGFCRGGLYRKYKILGGSVASRRRRPIAKMSPVTGMGFGLGLRLPQ